MEKEFLSKGIKHTLDISGTYIIFYSPENISDHRKE